MAEWLSGRQVSDCDRLGATKRLTTALAQVELILAPWLGQAASRWRFDEIKTVIQAILTIRQASRRGWLFRVCDYANLIVASQQTHYTLGIAGAPELVRVFGQNSSGCARFSDRVVPRTQFQCAGRLPVA